MKKYSTVLIRTDGIISGIWKGYVVSQAQLCQLRCLMAILDMFRPLLAIFRLSSRELKVLLYIYIYTHTHIYIGHARDGEISTYGPYCVM